MILRNVGIYLRVHTTSQNRRTTSASFIPDIFLGFINICFFNVLVWKCFSYHVITALFTNYTIPNISFIWMVFRLSIKKMGSYIIRFVPVYVCLWVWGREQKWSHPRLFNDTVSTAENRGWWDGQMIMNPGQIRINEANLFQGSFPEFVSTHRVKSRDNW
jgi:hypothetical protein